MGERITAKEYKKKRTRPKYGNKKVEIDGYKFDSKAEGRYYNHLQLLKKAGEIKDFTMQPKFRVMDGFKKHGKTHRAINYIADFEVIHNDNEIEVVDVKGMITQVFRIKEKMFHNKYPHKLTLVKWNKGRFEEI